MAMALPRGPLTLDDLAGFPDDGHRYELIDGSLLVTPAPSIAHQRTVGRLYRTLGDGLNVGLEVVIAPCDYVVSPGTVLEPDLLVAATEQLREDKLTSTPALVVEVLSPSTRAADLGSKRLAYQDAGVPTYWVIDLATATLIVHELDRHGVYEATVVKSPGTWTDPKLGITVDPRALCRPAD